MGVNLLRILERPDDAPIVLLLVIVPVVFLVAYRLACKTDAATARGCTPREAVLGDQAGLEDPVHSWPYLLRIELISAIVCTVVLIVWSIVLDAPLETQANPNFTPNPSKAPWYFQGLQELLVYFDPWIAGVAIPLAIIVGLVAIPYLDDNPAGNGYYSLRERRLAIPVFVSGFLLWFGLIVVGTLCRGPHWAWFWPGERWDHTRGVETATVDLPQFLSGGRVAGASGAGRAVGGGFLLLFIVSGVLGVRRVLSRSFPGTLERLGRGRFAVVAFLGVLMALVVLKIVLRLLFSVKYILVTDLLSI